ncbi:MAG: threonine synthase [Treponema sp.]|jgi:threonine synthase|nr:threonine synthase [Treponema sp.]
MYFCSTVSRNPKVSFKEAVLRCLPGEGELYVPIQAPDLRSFFLHMGEETSFPELAAAVIPLFFEGELNPHSAARIAESAFDFEPELTPLDEGFSLLKLYNGPTGTFKDFGINFLAALLEELLRGEAQGAMVVSAVRGDTGISIAKAFKRSNITTVLLYPRGPIHGLDRADYVPAGGNVIPIQVKGTLDDCQRLVGEIITDGAFAERYHITSANAVNPGRLLPQAFYFLYSFIKLKKRLSGDLVFSVPSGNFGNLIAGLYAWKFGMPVNGFIAAMNENNAFGDFIRGGAFIPKPLVSTISPALDVARPSNYARLLSFYQNAPAVMKHMVYPKSVDDAETTRAMQSAWEKYGVLLDPHGAVAFAAAESLAADRNFSGHIVIHGTGHPAKYAAEVLNATGQVIRLPEKLAVLTKKADPIAVIQPDLESLESAIAGC